MTDSPTAVLFRDIGGLVGPVVEGLSLVKTVADFVVDFVVTGCVDGVLRSHKKEKKIILTENCGSLDLQFYVGSLGNFYSSGSFTWT